MVDKLKGLIQTGTAKDTIIMLIGGGISTFLGFIFTVILARSISVFDLGLFITAFTFIQMVSEIFESGTNASVFNFVSASSGEERLSYIKATFLSKLFIAIVISCLVFLLSDKISNLFFKNASMAFYIRFASAGIFLTTLITWGQTVLKAERRFLGFSLNNLTLNSLKVLVILLLVAIGVRGAEVIYLGIVIIPIVTLALLGKQIGMKFTKAAITKKLYATLWKFSLPVGIGFACWALYTTIDQILVLNISGAKEAGIYGLAYKVASIIIFLASILGNVITPRFASLSDEHFFTYFKKTVLVCGGCGLVSLLSIVVAPALIPFLFGDKFSASIFPFQILAVAAALLLFSVPFSSAILYKFKKPYFMLWSSISYLIILWILLLNLTPLYASVGAAFSVLIMYIFQLLVSMGAFSYYLRVRNA